MTESEEGSLKVLLEEMNDKFSLVIEGHTALDGKMERFHQETKEDHRLAMDLIKYSHDELSAKIDGVRTELKEEIQGVREDLSAKIEDVGRKVDGHEERIRFLERKVA